MSNRNGAVGRVCRVDLAAGDIGAAREFYAELFGWSSETHRVAGGQVEHFMLGEDVVASGYQLSRRHLANGVPSHWTPYVGVEDVRASSRMAVRLGASLIVAPFDVPGVGAIALIQDPVGALLGLWQRSPE